MVDLISYFENVCEEAGEELAKQGVQYSKSFAPHDSGNLAGSIHSERTSISSWRVTTEAYGENGFAYPARIEAGEKVMPRKYGAVYFHGSWHLFADASKQSHFMEKTMSMLHI